MQKLAWLAANLINIHTKKKITIDKLLPKKKKETTDDEIKSKIVRVEEFLKKRGGRSNGR